jgi:hemerythrin
MRIEWSQALSTSVPEIDAQHKELIGRINALLDACSSNKPREEVGKVIVFLEGYVVTHFGAEERLMQASGYPGYARHHEEHGIFIDRVAEVKHKFFSEDAGAEVIHLAARTLIEWLDVHIRRTDRRLGEYLKAQEPG